MNNLRLLRKRNNKTQADLAKLMNVTQGTISNWEKGVTEIDFDSLTLLTEIFNCSADYILGLSENDMTNTLQAILNACIQLDEYEQIQVKAYAETLLENRQRMERDFPEIKKTIS